MENLSQTNVFVANRRPENLLESSANTELRLKRGDPSAKHLQPGDLILVRISGPDHGVKFIWYLDQLLQVTDSKEVSRIESRYDWLLRCKLLCELPSPFNEDFRGTSKLSEKIPDFRATRIQRQIILLKVAEARAYLEGILNEFGDGLDIQVEYMGKHIVARELLISVLQEVTREELGVEDEDTLSPDQIIEPYDPSKIKVDLKSFTVFQLMRKIKLKEIDLQPDFQRHVVWDEIRQSRLIESMLIGIPLPAFYLDAVNEDEWLVVDGLQRLSTLDRFYNRQDSSLQGLEFLKELHGKTFGELPRNFQRKIEETPLNLYLIQPETPAQVKFTIFTRINTGGLVLTAQEIRHCLFRGQATELLKELAEKEEFISATTNSISPKRMDDRECVLRFCAFHLQPYQEYQKTSNLDSLLSQTMAQINKMTKPSVEALGASFLESMTKAQSIFGAYAFRKMEEISGPRYPINKALFEVWSVSLGEYPLSKLMDHREDIISRFVSVIKSDYKFLKSISQATGSVSSVQKRFSTIQTLLKDATA